MPSKDSCNGNMANQYVFLPFPYIVHFSLETLLLICGIQLLFNDPFALLLFSGPSIPKRQC